MIFQNLLDDFRQLYPEVELLSEYIPQDKLLKEFIPKSKAGLGATVFIDFAQQIPDIAKSGSIQPLKEKTLNVSTFLPSIITQIRYQGKTYGIPLVSQVRVLCYNQAKLKPLPSTEDQTLTQPPFGLEWLKKAETQPNFILVRNRDILHDAFAQGRLTYYTVCLLHY